MSGSMLSSAALDERRRRILFRAWRRGMREMDLVMGQFADMNLPTMSEAELDEFERLLERPTRSSSPGSPARRRSRRNATRRCSPASALRRARR